MYALIIHVYQFFVKLNDEFLLFTNAYFSIRLVSGAELIPRIPKYKLAIKMSKVIPLNDCMVFSCR